MSATDEIKILFVEDRDEDTDVALRSFLKTGLPHKLLRLRDGEEAIAFIFRTGRFANRPPVLPRLVFLDIRMPKLDGIEVLRQLKSSEATRGIYVVILTSSANEVDRAECLRLGADDYLSKPVTPEIFLETLIKMESRNPSA